MKNPDLTPWYGLDVRFRAYNTRICGSGQTEACKEVNHGKLVCSMEKLFLVVHQLHIFRGCYKKKKQKDFTTMICDFIPGEEIEIQDMIDKGFKKYISAEYSEIGIQNFNTFVNSEALLNRYNSGNIIKTCKVNGKIVGMVEVKDNNHICLFFVDPDNHKQGIGKKLMEEIFSIIKRKSDCITVNSSTFAEKVYQALGFVKAEEQQEKNGIIYIPMKKTFV